MIRPYVFCPICKVVRPMGITVALQPMAEAEGESSEKVVLNYQCEVCCTFVLQTTYPDIQQNEHVVYIELQPSIPTF